MKQGTTGGYRLIPVAVLWLWVTMSPAFAADTTVQDYFRNLQSLQADFEQTVFDERNRVLQTSRGRMLMAKPDRFRWDYSEPYQQLIIADGDRLWQYDADLEQVTVRKLDQAVGATPLALLSGNVPVDSAFDVAPPIDSQGERWYVLTPKQTDSDFRELRIGFRDNTLSELELLDMFDRRTRLTLTDPQPNIALDRQLFQFTPPPGVDVIGDLP